MLSSARLMAILALLLGGCMTGRSGFDQLAPEEQSLFQRCSQPIGEHLCSGEEPEARALCLKKQAATFAARGSARMRRSWLRSNECPAATLEASTAPVAAEPAVAPQSSLAADAPAKAETPAEPVPAPAPPVAAPAPPVSEPAPAPAPTLAVAGGSCARSADCASDLCVKGSCASLAALTAEQTCPADPLANITVVAPAVAEGLLAAPVRQPAVEHNDKEPETTLVKGGPGAADQLREAIVTHEADMKRCVERQLKLVPTLNAEGTLVLEVNAIGRVTQAGLRGDQLQGTPLEGCLRSLASRWIFPRTARAYAVEAPLKVSGIESRRP
jgi:hypothetical protein